MSTLKGQHALITGGGSGIGLGAAQALAADGARVTLCGRTEEKLATGHATLEAAGIAAENVATAVCDVGDAEQLEAALSAANDQAPLTIVIANAGTGTAAPFLHTPMDEWDRVLRTNLTGAFLTLQLGGRLIAANGGGAMCAVSSIAGSHTHRFMAAYNSSKAGLNMLVRTAADELGSLGVRVNAVAPGLVETDISATLQNNPEVDEDYRLNMPLGRHGLTSDIGSAIRFLCGPESSWITGAVLPVDGGHHLRRGPNIDPLLAPFVPDLPTASPEL